MLGECTKDQIFEEREELMVSSMGGNPRLRTGHFLKPTVSSIDEGSSLKLRPRTDQHAYVFGWHCASHKWKEWVQLMEPIYHSVWKSAGIYEAIKATVYIIYKNNDLISGLAERWCSETNTFVFPWGEATITLEDIMILGGFSVLGSSPVDLSVEDPELVNAVDNLEKVRQDLIRMNSNSGSRWVDFFKKSGSKFEHEAFLSYWLSWFVFPGGGSDSIGKHIFPIAVNLARGTRVALAPAVLASIYSQLSSRGGYHSRFGTQMKFVQVWAWERLLSLQPQPVARRRNISERIRIALWNMLNTKDDTIKHVRVAIDSARQRFLWRPYTMDVDGWLVPKFYNERSKSRINGGDCLINQEMESFIRCLRVSELVGLDGCLELYQPHRVAMQFGYDQDIPKWISHLPPSDPKVAWYSYSRPVESNLRLYFPSNSLSDQPYVTARYLKWWRKKVLLLPTNVNQQMQSKRRAKGHPTKCDSIQSKVKNFPDGLSSLARTMATNIVPPPGSIQKNAAAERCDKLDDCAYKTSSNVSQISDSKKQHREGRTGSVVEIIFPDLVDLERRVARLERLAAVRKSLG